MSLPPPPPPPLSNLSGAAVERAKTPCLHLSPEPYQYSWVCRVRLCDGCLISLWSPCARPVGALMRQQQSAVWSAERTAACIDLHILSLPSARTQMLPTGTWIHASTVALLWVQSDLSTATKLRADHSPGRLQSQDQVDPSARYTEAT